MPMYHVGNRGVNQFAGAPVAAAQPRQSLQNNNFNFGAPPRNIDFQIDGLPPELQPEEFRQPMGFNDQFQNVLNNGAQIRVKKVYHLQKTDDLPLPFDDPKKVVTPMPPTPPQCDCENCLMKKQPSRTAPTAQMHQSPVNRRRNNHSVRPQEQCDCHACSPRKFCKCEDCLAAGHDPNCTCMDCRPDIHKKKTVSNVHTKNTRNRNAANLPSDRTVWNDDWNDDIPTIETPYDPPKREHRRNTYAAPPGPLYQPSQHNPTYSTTSEPIRRNTGLGFNKHLKGNSRNDDWTIATERSSKMWYNN